MPTAPPAPRLRGRPRAFSVDQALDRALDVFWTRGLAGSSLDELSAAMGIARPSLYAAFGDKEALYLAAGARFLARFTHAYVTAMAGAPTLRAGVLAYLRAAIALYTAGPHGRGCLAVCTAATEAPEHPAVRAWLAEIIATQDAAFTQTLIRARDRGELPAEADPALLGTMLSALQHTLAVRARAGTSAAALDRLAAAGVAVVLGPPPPKTQPKKRPRRTI